MHPRVAIVGGGPTAVYTVQALIQFGFQSQITIFESGPVVGMGMPYDPRYNHPALLANIASVEIPQVGPTLAAWTNALPPAKARRLGVTLPMDERRFPPRVLLGAYLADGLRHMVADAAPAGTDIALRADTPVTDVGYGPSGIEVSFGGKQPGAEIFDHVVLATGHVWPESDEAHQGRFASPWPTSQLLVPNDAGVAVLGSSLSAIDAAVTLALQNGRFTPAEGGLRFDKQPGRVLHITFFSRGGLLPEADFFHILPYLPLHFCTEDAIDGLIGAGTDGLLDQTFALIAQELQQADPFYATLIGLPALDADSFADAYFASRSTIDPFQHARDNLGESRENARCRRTVAWRYALLRMHETVAAIVPHLTDSDRARFDAGLKRLFMDNYAAVPLASVERLIALHESGMLAVEKVGEDECFKPEEQGVTLTRDGTTRHFDALIDARGQRKMRADDLPFPTLRAQIADQTDKDGFLAVGEDLLLSNPTSGSGTIHCAAVAYLLHREPFLQGIVETARMGESVAQGILSNERGVLPLQISA